MCLSEALYVMCVCVYVSGQLAKRLAQIRKDLTLLAKQMSPVEKGWERRHVRSEVLAYLT